MVQTLHSRTATNRNKRILRCQKEYRGLLTHRRASRTPLHSLRDYGPPFVPHKTSEVRKLNSHQQNKQQKDPGSGPGVPALPEMTTYASSPSVGPSMDRLFMCWPP
ncbi:hypothetical protein ACLKA7_017396 [Drosophila subpalustris]